MFESLIYLFQSNLYVESRNGTLISAVIPPTFQNCTQEGVRPGCLVKFDSPYEQCAQNRSGTDNSGQLLAALDQ